MDSYNQENNGSDKNTKSQGKFNYLYTTKKVDKTKKIEIIIQAIVAAVTLLLFIQTQKATKSASRSADAAESTFHEQRINDIIMRRRDSVNSSVNDSIERVRFELQRESIAEQDRLVNETRVEFEQENEPYLEATQFKIDRFETSKSGAVEFDVVNLAKQPAKAKGSVFGLWYANPSKSEKFIKNPFRFINFKLTKKDIGYFIKESPVRKFATFSDTNDIVKPEVIAAFKAGVLFIFIYGKIEYVNIRNNTNKTYVFVAKLNFEDAVAKEVTGTVPYTYVYNENK